MAKAAKKSQKPQKALRKGASRRLRELLTDTPTSIPEMMAGLEMDEAAVLEGLRRHGSAFLRCPEGVKLDLNGAGGLLKGGLSVLLTLHGLGGCVLLGLP